MKKVVDVADFGSSVPFETHARIRFAHAGAAVDHLQKGFACILDNQFDFGGTASTAFSNNSFTALAGR